MITKLLLGFVVIGGILLGYVAARLGPPWMVWAVWGVSIVGAVLFWFWAVNFDDSQGLVGIVVLVAMVMPFVGCVGISGLIGMIARKVANRTPSE
ncbi:MAG TPA: hypothetical protein EYP31_08690 [Roseibacterium sp.]|nr:hypothetical protein [Roseibacterium sp.]